MIVTQVTSAITVLQMSLAGCGTAPSAVRVGSIDSSAVAAQIIEQNDANNDGILDEGELAKCTPLASRLANYDADGDGSISLEEAASRLERLYNSGSMLVSVDCTVTYRGRPLPGASVLFRPVAMLDGQTLPAQGTTDDSGMTQLTISDGSVSDSSAMQPGLYYVEITHPQQRLPSRYNVETELDFEVDPVSRDGLTARFDLK